jgi:hypothetical protein
MKIVWKLSEDGKVLALYRADPVTRRLDLLLRLSRAKPMTEAEAMKYVEDNYPDKGSVRAAADSLGILRSR